MSAQKGFASILLILAAAGIIATAGLVIWNNSKTHPQKIDQNPSSITKEASSNPADQTDTLLLTKNFVDLANISSISKYRSCEGHLVISCDQKETKRNMKHYFRPKSQFLGTNNQLKLFAPFDGVVYKIFRNQDVTEVSIYPKSEKSYFNPSKYWNFTIQHINLLPNITEGSQVNAGELIGYADFTKQIGSFDINVNKSNFGNEEGGKPGIGSTEEERKAMFKKNGGNGNFANSGITTIDGWGCPYSDLADVFDFMSDTVLADYAAHGVGDKSQMSFTKEYRDAHACVYIGSGPYFSPDYNADGDWVYLK